MLRFLISGACLLLAASAAAAQAPQQIASAGEARTTCDAKYYGYLVGKGLDEARAIQAGEYRVLPANSALGEANPKRMTILYDSRSNVITEVACG